MKNPKRPKDTNQRAKFIVDLATGQTEEQAYTPTETSKNPAAVLLGRLGGLKGGKARAASLTAKRRKEIAKGAAMVRWKKGK